MIVSFGHELNHSQDKKCEHGNRNSVMVIVCINHRLVTFAHILDHINVQHAKS